MKWDMMPGLLEIMSLIWAWIIWHVFFKMADFPVVCANYGVQGTVFGGACQTVCYFGT